MSIRWQSKERGKMKKKKAAAKTEKQGEIAGKQSLINEIDSFQLRESVRIYVEMKAQRIQLEILHGILDRAAKNRGKSAIFPHIKGDVNISAALNRVNNVNTVECQMLTRKIMELLVEPFKE